jgi:hypothetical protein
MLNIKTYIVSVAYARGDGRVAAGYDSAHRTPSLAQIRVDELHEIFKEKGITNYDIDVVAALIEGDQYKAGI